MTYDSPLSAFKGKVIPEVASFKEESLVTLRKRKVENMLEQLTGPIKIDLAQS